MSIAVLLQYIYPQHLITRIVRILATCQWKWFKNWGIRRLIRVHKVNISEAISDKLDDYPDFNSFFTRRLKPSLRPITPFTEQIASPVDGTISQIGRINNNQILQAKNFNYSLLSLLGNQEAWAELFKDGQFATIYLAPRDYHRVHMPYEGKLKQTLYIPGRLFSVNPLTTDHVPRLFTRNERLICLFESPIGPITVILVGAMLVGQMRTVWNKTPHLNPLSPSEPAKQIALQKGDEMGHFLMGSTVIILFPNGRTIWNPALRANSILKLGQGIGTIVPPT